MPYSEQELEDIGRDPVRLRAWWWHMSMHDERLARNKRKQSRSLASINHVVTDYQESYDDGAEMVRWAEISERMAIVVREHLDALVRSSLEPARCTCGNPHS